MNTLGFSYNYMSGAIITIGKCVFSVSLINKY